MSSKRLHFVILVPITLLLIFNFSAFGRSPSDDKDVKKPAADNSEKSAVPSSDGRAAESKPEPVGAGEQLRVLNEKVRKLEMIIEQQQHAIEVLQSGQPTQAVPAMKPGSSATSMTATTAAAVIGGANDPAKMGDSSNVKSAPMRPAATEDSPLQIHIGSATITPVGFMDFTSVFRSTNTGAGIGSNFGGVPFKNTPAGRLTEVRLSAQNSRIGARFDADVLGSHVIGYLESDFLGFFPTNSAVTTNSDSMRMRLYWVDVRKEKWEFMGGQSWSLMTPNRNGISPLPNDVFFSQTVDVNYQLGLTWARQPGFRFVYHPSDEVAFAVALENPEQYIGGSAGAGIVTLPTALVTPYAAQLNNGGTTLSVPNLHPDIIAKLAFDPSVGGRQFHIEFAGVARSFKVFNPLSNQSFTTTGGGGSVNLNLELVKNFRFIMNNYLSDGGGRYIFGQAPDVIIRGDGSPSLVHSFSNVTGFEAQAGKNTLLYGYYGGVYINKNTAIDPSTGRLVGYGFAGAPSSQNRSVQEATFGFTQTFWKDAKYGGLKLMGQYSYVTRSPWSFAPGTPENAHTNTVFINLRYELPGAPPKVGK